MSQLKEESTFEHFYYNALTCCDADVFKTQENKTINIITKCFEGLQDTVDIKLCMILHRNILINSRYFGTQIYLKLTQCNRRLRMFSCE